MKIKLKLDYSTFITSLIKICSLTCNSSNIILERKHDMKNTRRKENAKRIYERGKHLNDTNLRITVLTDTKN